MHNPIVNIAIDAALAAGKLIIRASERMDKVSVTEKQPNDFVTEIDQRVERDIIAAIKKAYPTHGVLGEESGEINGEGSEYLWVIDPIDGTRNFIHGFPHYAVSIAVFYKNKLEHGVIYDPNKQELFTASRGKGAYLNDRRIRVSGRKTLEGALLGTGFAYRHINKDPTTLAAKMFNAILPQCGDIRRAGAATLDLAYVACGRFDGFWELGLHLWDIAAGILLIKEAGGLVSDPEGGEDYLKSGNVVAANPALLKLMLKSFRSEME